MDGGKIGEFLVVWGVGSNMGNMEGVGKCVGGWRIAGGR